MVLERSLLSTNKLLPYSKTYLQNALQQDDIIADLRTQYGKNFLPIEHDLVFYDRGNGILQAANGLYFSPELGICVGLFSDTEINGIPANKFKINTEAYERLSIWKKILTFLNNFFLVNDLKDFAVENTRYPSLE
jgi:hypothetical protein